MGGGCNSLPKYFLQYRGEEAHERFECFLGDGAVAPLVARDAV